MTVEMLDSLEADFEKMTWTFGLGLNSEVGAGRYAIVPYGDYLKMTARLERAEQLLRSMRQISSLCDYDKERVDSFFDPAPLA
jgi:hypothetical protein